MDDQDNIQQLLSPLKRLKTTTTSMEINNEELTKTEPMKTNLKSHYLVKVNLQWINSIILFYQVYDTTEDILLNTMVEFIGIYYDHPVIKADNMQAA